MTQNAGWRGSFTTRLLVAGALGLAALGQASPDDLARRHFESGEAYLAESDYEHALQAFQKAFDLSKRPELLINIATVNERMGKLQPAIDALHGYLAAAPEGELRATVELRIKNLQARLDAQPADAGAAPPPPPPTASVAPPPPSASAAPPPSPPPETKPSNPNIPAYVLLGVGALAAGGAVLTGVLAQGEYDDAKKKCAPACSDEQVSTGETMALTSTILTGVAVVGVGLGATLLLAGGSSGPDQAARSMPRVDVAVGARGAAASARWSF